MTAPRVIALGQPLAGDDGVALAVLEALRARPALPACELHAAGEASALLTLLEGAAGVVVVDAVVGPEPGAVLVLAHGDLAAKALRPLSSHGLDAVSAVELHAALCPSPPPVVFVGIGVAPPRPTGPGLSAAVASAVPVAVQRIVELLAAPFSDENSAALAR